MTSRLDGPSERRLAQGNSDGSYAIDPAELARVYPFPAPTEVTGDTGEMAHRATQEAALAAEVAGLREMAAMLRGRAPGA